MKKAIAFLLLFQLVGAQVFGELKPAARKEAKGKPEISKGIELAGILWAPGYKRAVFLIKEGYRILKEGEGDFKLKVIKIEETGVVVSIKGRRRFFSLRKKKKMKGGKR